MAPLEQNVVDHGMKVLLVPIKMTFQTTSAITGHINKG